jgi:uncharacterized protein with beta-barrel porin domain
VLVAGLALSLVPTWSERATAACISHLCFTPDSSGSVHLSGGGALFDLGTRFLQRLGALASFQTAASAGNNPQGGGDDAPAERYRAWLEGYGMFTRTDTQGDFAGDRRRAAGVVAGAGWTIFPGATIGLSVDQSRTKIDVQDIAQSARVDLTQIGLNASFEHGPWTFGAALIYGFGSLHSSRTDIGGESVASYNAALFGAMAELSYYWALPDNSRLIPKLTLDGLRSHADAFAESGGLAPIQGGAMTATRYRLLAGAEIGHSWLVDRKLFDVSAYGRLVDNLKQDMGTLQVTGTGGTVSIGGAPESMYGADAGATLSAKITQLARLYAVYDGRFRSHFTAHTGTLGVEWRW